MRAHEFPPGVPWANTRCLHCGGLWQPQMEATCIERPGEAPAPEPARRVPALDDVEALRARMAELQREREAAANVA